MIQAKDAATRAVTYLREMYEGQELRDVRLEEVEWREHAEGPRWLLTLSFRRESDASELETALGVSGGREYKIFTIDARDGSLLAMKIRALQ